MGAVVAVVPVVPWVLQGRWEDEIERAEQIGGQRKTLRVRDVYGCRWCVCVRRGEGRDWISERVDVWEDVGVGRLDGCMGSRGEVRCRVVYIEVGERKAG